MTIEQLRSLSDVCEEELFAEDTYIFKEGDEGGTLYVIIDGKIGIEQAGQRRGSINRLSTLETHDYFGEADLFGHGLRTTSAVALQDTLTLSLRREPLVMLARQYPDLSLEVINVLSQRLREVNAKIADRSRTKSTGVQNFLNQFD